MNRSSIDIIADVIRDLTGESIDDLISSSNIYLDFEIDSLDARHIVLEIEKRTGIWIAVESMAALDTVAKIAARMSQGSDNRT